MRGEFPLVESRRRVIVWRHAVFLPALTAIALAGTGTRTAMSEELTAVPLRDEMPALVAALDAGICRWREVVEFVGHYRHRLVFARSEEDAVAWRFVDPETLQPVDGDFVVPGDSESADGFVAKRSDAFRWRHIRITKIFESNGQVANAPFDLAVANGVEIMYRPTFGVEGKEYAGGNMDAMVIRKTGFAARFPQVAVSDMPLFAVGGSDETRFGERAGHEERIRWAYRRLTKSQVVVIVERTAAPSAGGAARASSVVGSRTHYFVRTDAVYPVIERIDTYLVEDGRIGERLGTTVMSDFISCGRCLVPRRVVSTIRKLAPLKKDAPALWLARTWASDDLGSRPPRDDDFSITVPKGTRIHGLRDRRAAYSVLRMSPDDVVQSRSSAPPPEDAASGLSGSGEMPAPTTLWSTRVIGGVVLLAGILLVAAGGRLAAGSRER